MFLASFAERLLQLAIQKQSSSKFRRVVVEKFFEFLKSIFRLRVLFRIFIVFMLIDIKSVQRCVSLSCVFSVEARNNVNQLLLCATLNVC
jgi:hypothetical protein